MTDTDATVYTKPGCKLCNRVIEKLEKAGVNYDVVDVSLPEYEDALSFITNVYKAKSLPVVDSAVMDPILGYQPEKVKALIEALTTNGERDK